MNRRQFLKAAVASTIIPAVMRVRDVRAETGEMQYRTLGPTGQKVSIVGLGGAHIGLTQVSEADSVRIVRIAIENGINFMDNS